jgi:hypothetical protein
MGSTTEEMAAIGEANPRQCKRPRTRRLEELAAGSGENVFEDKNVLDAGRPFNTKCLHARTWLQTLVWASTSRKTSSSQISGYFKHLTK